MAILDCQQMTISSEPIGTKYGLSGEKAMRGTIQEPIISPASILIVIILWSGVHKGFFIPGPKRSTIRAYLIETDFPRQALILINS